MTKKNNNRLYVRFELDIPADLTVMNGDRESVIRSLITDDLSAAGSFFKTDDPLPLGTQVQMDIILPLKDIEDLQVKRSHARLKVVGLVVRTSESGMALKFEINKIVIDDDFGMVRDLEFKLEWYLGPGMDMNWHEAKSWVENLTAEGGGWRMPTPEELESLYEPSAEKIYKIDRVFPLTAGNVWSVNSQDDSQALYFDFVKGRIGRRSPDESESTRAMAVRNYNA